MALIQELKLTDIGVDCLERIFRYLRLDDLMNVADANKQLKEAADLVFFLRHGNKVLKIGGFCSLPIKYVIFDSIISVHLKITLQLLRCFGHLLHELDIDINVKSFVDNVKLLDVHMDHVIFYVKQYCIGTLIELNILEAPDCFALNRFENPFPNVHTATVRACDLTKVSLLELLPKIKRLTYICHQISDFAGIESSVQTLDHLEIIVSSSKNGELFRKIRLNPRMQSLAVPFCVIYQGINEVLPHLTDLRVNYEYVYRFTENPNSIKFHFTTVKRFEMRNAFLLRQMPFYFDNLEELVMGFGGSHALSACYLNDPEKFFDFLAEHSSIKILKILGQSTQFDLRKLNNMLPLMREFKVSGSFLLHDVIRFMERKKALKIMTVYLINHHLPRDHAVVQMQLSEGWTLIKEKHGLSFIFARN